MKKTSASIFLGWGLVAAVVAMSACTAEPVQESPVASTPVEQAEPQEAEAEAVVTASAGRALAVQSPVWIEREGKKTPLKPGTTVESGDTLVTGKGGRVHMALEDASTVKLGENAALEVAALDTRQTEDEEDGVLTGTLKVLRGAFRYTTSALEGVSRRRDLAVVIGGVFTAGVRGTDIWGKSDAGQDLVCLIEGEIDVRTEEGLTQHMDQPGTFYVVPKGEAPNPVVEVPAEKLKGWIPQTELTPDAPALTEDGAWSVGLVSFASEAAAQKTVDKLAAQGVPAEAAATTVKGKTWHRVALAGFASRAVAARYRDAARKQGFKTAWIVPPA